MTRRFTRTLLLSVFCGLALSSGAARAAGPRDSLVVTADWLAQHLKDPGLVILHVGEQKTYDEGHIPGAQFILMDDISAPMDHATMKPTDLMLEMPDAARLHDALQRFGVSDHSRIIVYYSDEWFSPSTRVIYTLDYAGLGANTSMLLGGLPAWTGSGHAVTADVSVIKPGVLSPLKLKSDLIVDADFVKTQAKTRPYVLVDGRARSAYDGVRPANGNPEMPLGHIPGAASVPFTDMFDDHGVLRPASELEAAFAKAGVRSGDTVVGYCWIGQQATAMLFAARTLGHAVRLYDGSITGWNALKLPLEVSRKDAGR